MTTQFPIIYIDELISEGMPVAEIFQSILCHSPDEEEREELLLYNFLIDADLSTIDDDEQYSVDPTNVTNH